MNGRKPNSQIHQQYLCNHFSTMPLQYICTTDINIWKERPSAMYTSYMVKLSIKHSFICYTVNRERFAGLNFCIFHGFSGVPWKFFCEYKHLSLIVLNNEHLWPKQCESISMKTLMALKSWVFISANLSPSTVVSKLQLALEWCVYSHDMVNT